MTFGCGCNTGLGCNEKRVIEILGRRTQAQRMEIAQAYQTIFGESLHKRLKQSLSGKLEVRFSTIFCRCEMFNSAASDCLSFRRKRETFTENPWLGDTIISHVFFVTRHC